MQPLQNMQMCLLFGCSEPYRLLRLAAAAAPPAFKVLRNVLLLTQYIRCTVYCLLFTITVIQQHTKTNAKAASIKHKAKKGMHKANA